MKPYSNQDAIGWIVLLVVCCAFVACGAHEGTCVDFTQNHVYANDFESSSSTTFGKLLASNFENALTSDSELAEILRLSTRRLRLFPGNAREFQAFANRLTFERVGSRVVLRRSFCFSSFPSQPLFISFLKLRN